MVRFALLACTLACVLACAVGVFGCAPGKHGPPPSYVPRPGDPVVAAGSLAVARHGHTATVTSAGVLVAGGRTLTEAATDTAELLDPRSGVSVPLDAALTSPRSGHAAVALDGDVLLLGGRDAAGRALASLERYDVARRRFVALGVRLAAPRADFGCARVGARFVVVGGAGGERDTLEVWRLAPLGREAVYDLPGRARADVQAVAVDEGTVFVYGDGAPPLWVDLATGRAQTVNSRDVLFGATAFSTPQVPGAVLLAGGRSRPTGKLARGVQLLRPGAEPEGAPVGTLVHRLRPVVVPAPEATYVFAGTVGGLPVALSERLVPGETRLLPEVFGAVHRQAAAFVGPEHVVLCGGLGADGLPSSLVSVLAPAEAVGDGDLFAAVAAAQERSQRVDAELAQARGERDAALARAREASDALGRRRAELAAEEDLARRLRGALEAAGAEADALEARLADGAAQGAAVARELDALRAREARLRAELGGVEARLAGLRLFP
ncbi:MAG: hypothetical protein D6731_17290 [Planctomycetota bacterium]|nr:MAG: hypothetical protein D6731_17290 [Planctomycetota bacterium]